MTARGPYHRLSAVNIISRNANKIARIINLTRFTLQAVICTVLRARRPVDGSTVDSYRDATAALNLRPDLLEAGRAFRDAGRQARDQTSISGQVKSRICMPTHCSCGDIRQ